MELKICHLYPDVLNLYGDGGNIICMKRRLQWRGIDAAVTKMPIGSTQSLAGFDLVFIGGGQDFEQQVLLEDLHRGRDKEIKAAIDDGVTFLTICGGYQMLGEYYETYDGKRCDFIGALELYTVGSKKRMIGNYEFKCTENAGGSVVVGFENHSGKKVEARSNGLGLKVSYCGMDGKTLNPSSLVQGTEFTAIITVTNHNSVRDCDNVALTQAIPSGWEIINDRIFFGEYRVRGWV